MERYSFLLPGLTVNAFSSHLVSSSSFPFLSSYHMSYLILSHLILSSSVPLVRHLSRGDQFAGISHSLPGRTTATEGIFPLPPPYPGANASPKTKYSTGKKILSFCLETDFCRTLCLSPIYLSVRVSIRLSN